MKIHKPRRLKSRPWTPLQTGDVLDIVAPGFACEREVLENAAAFVESLGLIPRYPRDLIKKPGLCAQTDEKRLRYLKYALYSPESRGVWCLRGGYGSLRLLPGLWKSKPPKESKFFIGYSDITSLHCFLNAYWSWPTIHGPVLDRFADKKSRLGPEVREAQSLIFGRQRKINFRGLKPLNEPAMRKKTVVGQVLGGNMMTLQSSLATPWQIQPQSKILVFEEIGEKAHKIDRILTQMNQAQIFKGVKAVVFGDMVYDSGPIETKIWREVVLPFAQKARFPVLRGLKVGHGDRQRCLPLGTESKLFLGGRPSLQVDSGFRGVIR